MVSFLLYTGRPGTVTQGGTASLQIKKGQSGFLRLDLWYRGADRFNVTIVTPSGTFGPYNLVAYATPVAAILGGIVAGNLSNRVFGSRRAPVIFFAFCGQALTLLMATLVRPELLLLDEHTAALDPRSAEQVVRLTEEIVRRDALTTLMVTHSMHQAVRLGNRVLMMHRGRVVEDIAGARKRRLRVEDLLDTFDRLRNSDLLDESAAEMLRREYV